MSAFAAVTTGKATGAIAVIQLAGDSSESIVKKIFVPIGKKPVAFKPGKILLGTISDGSETIDQVVIGCEAPGQFAINCHGNPLIVADIMQLLQRNGVELLTAEQLLTKNFSAENHPNTIALEAKLTQLQAKTIQGTKIIVNQDSAGLTKTIEKWRQDATSLETIKSNAEQILKDSSTAKLIIFGCTAVLSGPPNTGKSTLLNFLAGRQKAIVTDIAGTTRDWVSAQCLIGPLSVEFIDTAGLTETLGDTIEKASQQKAVELLDKADLVLLVLDNSRPAEQLDKKLLDKIAKRRILTVLNKSDLPANFDTGKLPKNLANIVQISAKFGNGTENLLKKIQIICGVTDFNLKTPVCFTARQENLLKQLQKAKSEQHALSIITELLNAPLSV
ncbi:MAG: 50S ribosome-binding GTPase [Phycisphaerae bacterium]|nr:50S ribosome-binding GTPase [Phycisphaerae bacterium]MDD5380105.1 50S ribosome-binding GTPase [Phycisphaerae bacterium]